MTEPLFHSLHTGKAGSGHFVKMAHNAIEYGMMQAIGEGLELIEAGPYKDTDLVKVCRLWNTSLSPPTIMDIPFSAPLGPPLQPASR